jgi:protein ImuB
VRTACLLVPDLPLAAELRAHPELRGDPLAIATGPGPRAELVAVSSEAAERGVRRGSTVAHARAVCAELIVRPASPALETTARDALLDAALSVSPRAALAPRASGSFSAEAAVYLDASGIESLFHSESGFAAALSARASRLGLPGNIAVATSRGIAHVAARQLRGGEQTCILPRGAEAPFLAPLPIDVFDPEDALADTLTRFCIHTIRDLLALPRRALGTRLGPDVLRLIELARGREIDTPLPVPSTRLLLEAIDLDFPIDRLEPLGFVLQGLLSRLLARLDSRRLACEDLTLTLHLEGGGNDARRIRAAAPTQDLRVLVRLLAHALESHPPTAAIESVTLETAGCPVGGDQLDLFRPAGPAPAVLGRTLAELEALCGSGRIGSPQVADDHRPDSFRMAPFQPGAHRDAPPPSARTRPGTLAIRALRPPVTAQVRVARGLPAFVTSAIANGRVVQLAGPWRTTGSWWSREERFAYDSFDIQTSDGTVARLRLDHMRKLWQIDGVYD